MKPKICPRCKHYMSNDNNEYWCDWCDYEKPIEMKPQRSWSDD